MKKSAYFFSAFLGLASISVGAQSLFDAANQTLSNTPPGSGADSGISNLINNSQSEDSAEQSMIEKKINQPEPKPAAAAATDVKAVDNKAPAKKK